MDVQTLDYRNILYSPLFSRMLVSLIILSIGIIIGRIIGKIIYRVLNELSVDKLINDTTKIKLSLEKIISNFISFFIYFITFIIVLTHLGLNTTVLNIIIVAIIVIIIIATIFIVKDFFPNIISGIILRQKNNIKEGDLIKVGDKEGKITNINMIETTIKTEKGDIVYIPNSILAKNEITKIFNKGD